jgi:hypothetical protein
MNRAEIDNRPPAVASPLRALLCGGCRCVKRSQALNAALTVIFLSAEIMGRSHNKTPWIESQ